MTITRNPDGTYQIVSAETPPPLSEEECNATHKGFTVTCDACGSKRVIFENGIGYSPESGTWGTADLQCLECGMGVELIDP